MNSTAHLTPNTAGLGSAAETPHSTSISLSVCAYNPGLTFMLLMIQWRAVSFWHYSYYSSFSHRCGQCSALCEIYCITVRKSSRSKVTRTDVVPPFLPTFNLFLFLVYISSFHMPRRKMYKCRGTTETAITAVCAHVWTCAPPVWHTHRKNENNTVCDAQHAATAHTQETCQYTWASLSTGVSHITLNEQKSLSLPAVALACHAECSVTVCTVNCLGTNSQPCSLLFYAVLKQNFSVLAFVPFFVCDCVFSFISCGWALSSNACLESSIVQWCLLFNTSFTFYRPLTHFFTFFCMEKSTMPPCSSS